MARELQEASHPSDSHEDQKVQSSRPSIDSMLLIHINATLPILLESLVSESSKTRFTLSIRKPSEYSVELEQSHNVSAFLIDNYLLIPEYRNEFHVVEPIL